MHFLNFYAKSNTYQFLGAKQRPSQNLGDICKILKIYHVQSSVKIQQFYILTSSFLLCIPLIMKISEIINVITFERHLKIINWHPGHRVISRIIKRYRTRSLKVSPFGHFLPCVFCTKLLGYQ